MLSDFLKKVIDNYSGVHLFPEMTVTVREKFQSFKCKLLKECAKHSASFHSNSCNAVDLKKSAFSMKGLYKN